MTAAPIKILQLCLRPSEETVTGLFQVIAAGLPQPEFDVTTAYLKADKKNLVDSNDKQRHCFNIPSRTLKGLRLRAVWQLLPFFKQKKVDIVIAHSFKASYILALVALWVPIRKKISVIHDIEGYKRPYQKLFARCFMRHFTIVAVSQAVKDHLLSQRCGFRPEHIVVIHNAIDINCVQSAQLPKAQARADLKLPDDVFVVGLVARLVPCKGHSYLIDAFSASDMPNAHLVLIGDGREQAALEAQAQRLNLQTRIHFVGKIPDAFRYMRAFDVFALPSIEEGLGMVLLEAMAAKLPVIASRAGGIPEVIGDLVPLCPVKDSHSLQQRLQYYYDASETIRQQAGEQAYLRLCQAFSLPQYHEAFRALCRRQA
jgi:glycosyltransferase involved in cell wall biosynthesis